MNALSSHIQTPQRLAIFGASGGIGKELVSRALAAGHQVTALVRNPERLETRHDNLRIVVGDATDPHAVGQTLQHADAVAVALGAPALSSSRVRSAGTQCIVDGMRDHNIERIVCVSVLGVGDSYASLPFWLKYFVFPLYLRRAVADHQRQEDVLQGSQLAWTAVRPPFLTDGPATKRYAHGFGDDLGGLTLDISRADVAAFMLEQLDSDDYLKSTPGISYAKSASATRQASAA